MRVVRMQDVGPQVLDDARELPSGVQIHLGAWRETDEIVPFRCSSGELALRVGNQHGPVPSFAQPEHGEQHLALSASPGPRGVDVE